MPLINIDGEVGSSKNKSKAWATERDREGEKKGERFFKIK